MIALWTLNSSLAVMIVKSEYVPESSSLCGHGKNTGKIENKITVLGNALQHLITGIHTHCDSLLKSEYQELNEIHRNCCHGM